MAQTSFTQIDLSVLPPPNLIEEVDYEVIRSRYWDDVISKNPALTAARELEQSPANMILGVQAYGEMLVRLRVNAGARAVLAPFARGADLDTVVSRNGITRLVVTPKDPTKGIEKDIMESDANLLRRYLLSFDGRSAGSADRFLLEVYSALPLVHHAKVNGRAIHGRRGDVDIIVIGPDGRHLTSEEMHVVTMAVLDPAVAPEAVSVAVINAVRKPFAVDLKLSIPFGPDPVVVANDIKTKITAAMRARLQIGANVPPGFARGLAFNDNVIDVIDNAPFSMESDPMAIPVCTGVTVNYEVV